MTTDIKVFEVIKGLTTTDLLKVHEVVSRELDKREKAPEREYKKFQRRSGWLS